MKGKRWIFGENLVFLLKFSPRGDTSPLLMPSGLLPEEPQTPIVLGSMSGSGPEHCSHSWALPPGLTGTFIPAGKLEFSSGTEATKPKGENEPVQQRFVPSCEGQGRSVGKSPLPSAKGR